MGQLIIYDPKIMSHYPSRGFYDLDKYYKIQFWLSDEYKQKNPDAILDYMEWKKWVISELHGEVIVKEESSTIWRFSYMYILLDEDYVKFTFSKWYNRLALNS